MLLKRFDKIFLAVKRQDFSQKSQVVAGSSRFWQVLAGFGA
jgi:hypothetical protein